MLSNRPAIISIGSIGFTTGGSAVTGILTDADLYEDEFGVSPPPNWQGTGSSEFGEYLFQDNASGAGTREAFNSISTVSGSQAFSVVVQFVDDPITLQVHRVTEAGTDPFLGQLFTIEETLYSEVFSTNGTFTGRSF